MKRTYSSPKAKALLLFLESRCMSGQSGTGSGSDMETPDTGQNPF